MLEAKWRVSVSARSVKRLLGPRSDDELACGLLHDQTADRWIAERNVESAGHPSGAHAGAILAAKMGSIDPQKLTAVAMVEGFTGFAARDALVPTAPLSIMMFRGTAGTVVPYTSDVPFSLFHAEVYSAVGSASDWAQANGCASTPTTAQINGGQIVLTDYKGGTGGVEMQLMTVNGGKHTYASGDADLIWQFFLTQKKVTQP